MASGSSARIPTSPTDAKTPQRGAPGVAGHDEGDDELLRRIADGDQKAFRRLVERHVDRAYALALRILKRPADAEDVVQDTLLKVWTNRGRWQEGRAKFSTWLYRVVTNRCIDLIRQPATEDMERVSEPEDGRPDAMKRLLRQEAVGVVERAMERLPEQQRIALILSYYENLGNAEIAEVMNTTVMAVESLLKRGREQLRKLLRRGGSEIIDSLTDA